MSNGSVISRILNTGVPNSLYHYTSSAGLMGIIKSNKIWTTKIHYLNDKSEIQLAFKHIRNEIDSQKNGKGKTRSDEELNAMMEILESVEGINVSVASFTEVGDQLSQWRGYCEIGDGYSIGFNGKKLMEHVDKSENYRLVPCVYEEKKQLEIVKELVNSAPVIDITNHPNYGKPPFYNMPFGDAALFLAPIIKSESFREEKEWRLISSALSIIIGPTPEEDLSERAVWGFFLSVSRDNLHLWTNIKHSKIPFRKI
jgi:hypothetical protein